MNEMYRKRFTRVDAEHVILLRKFSREKLGLRGVLRLAKPSVVRRTDNSSSSSNPCFSEHVTSQNIHSET